MGAAGCRSLLCSLQVDAYVAEVHAKCETGLVCALAPKSRKQALNPKAIYFAHLRMCLKTIGVFCLLLCKSLRRSKLI